MRTAVFSTLPHDRRSLQAENADFRHELVFLDEPLGPATVGLARGFPAVCAFVNDDLSRPLLEALAAGGTRVVALRSAGVNNVDLAAAEGLGLTVVRVPACSQHAVAEHTVALVLALNRKIHQAYARVRQGDFSLEGLVGFDLFGGGGGGVAPPRIGRAVARIFLGFGCTVVAHDPVPSPELERRGIPYLPLPELYARSHVVTLHCPLSPETHHLVNAEALAQMRPGAMLINTGRGALVDAAAVIEALRSGRLGYLGLDVYEQEQDLFFQDRSQRAILDDVIARLLAFPNVVVTGHQAFLTQEALAAIGRTTLQNLADLEEGRPCRNVVGPAPARPAG